MQIVGELLREGLDSLFGGGPAYFAGALVLAGVGLLGRMYMARKRLSFEEDFNSKIGIVPFARNDDPASDILRVFNSVSVVVIRVWNSGRATIDADDYARALRFVVHERYIVDFRLSEPRPDTLRGRVETEGRVSAVVGDIGDPPPSRARQALIEALPDSLLAPTDEQRTTSRELNLPRLEMKRGDEFRLVVCLREDEPAARNAQTDKGYTFGGTLKPGKIIDQDVPRRRYSATRLLSAAVVVLLVLFVGAVVWRTDTPGYCGDGTLRLVGSNAFAPVVADLSTRYRSRCGGAKFDLAMNGSLDGVRELQESTAPDLVAFSDGPAAGSTLDLQARPVAVLVFALVVNAGAGVQDLTTDQVRSIYAGQVRSWAEVGGADLPIRMVSRNADSGSRRAFEDSVLGGRESLPVTSNDCQTLDPPSAGTSVVRCERGTTDEVLQEVDVTPGSVGYANASTAAGYSGLRRVSLGGDEPAAEYLASGYPFWAVEYAYTRGFPAVESLRSRFVGYLSSEEAALELQEAGYVPCLAADGLTKPICVTGPA